MLKKIVYSYYCLDILHVGHLKMMKKSKEMGGPNCELIVGILTDAAIIEKKPHPIINFHERVELAESIKYIDKVIPQNTYSPIPNIEKIKPDILMESSSHDKEDIALYGSYMEKIGGKVIVVPYFRGQSSSLIKQKIRSYN